MTVYAAAFSTKELSYDDFFFVMAHYPDSGIKSFSGSIDFIRLRSAENTFAYVFRGMDVNYDLKNLPIVLLLAHDMEDREADANVHLMNKHEEAISIFITTLAVLAEPNDLETYTTRNGNGVSVLKDINVKNVSDLFTNSARSEIHSV
ncbi:MAG: hypothetical protein WC052_05830 [Patescibacteria group bacterium]